MRTYRTNGLKIYVALLRVFSQQRQQIGYGHVYIEYTKSAKSTAIEYTQEVPRIRPMLMQSR